MRAGDVDLVLDQRFVADHLAAEYKSVADHQSLDESLFDFAEHSPAARQRPGRSRAAAARTHQAHFQHGIFDDGADVETVALPHARISDPPAPLAVPLDAGKTLVGFQRIATGGDEIDHVVEIGTWQA